MNIIFENTGILFLILILILIIIYILCKISLSKIFIKTNEKKYKAFIPFYNIKVLLKIIKSNQKFINTLIPFLNIYIYHKIYKEMCKSFNMKEKKAILFHFIPLVMVYEISGPNYPYLYKEEEPNIYLEIQESMADKGSEEEQKVIKNDYSLYEEKLPAAEQMLKVENINLGPLANSYSINNNINQDVSFPTVEEIKIDDNVPVIDIDSNQSNIYSDNYIKEEEKIDIIETKDKKQKETTTISHSGYTECPNCHAKLVKGATACFMCGAKLQ